MLLVLVLFDEIVEFPPDEAVDVELDAEFVAEAVGVMVTTMGTLTVVSTRLPSAVVMPTDWENEVERTADCSQPEQQQM